MSNDTTLYTVGEVAERFSLTVRTLHYWESLGLLAPAARSWSNYRLYSTEDCARVQRIGGRTPEEAARAARCSPFADGHHDRSADTLWEDAMNDNALTVEEIGEILGDADFAAHQDEAEECFGDTNDWRESRRRTASWHGAEWRQNSARFHDVEQRMIEAIRAGVAPDSERAAGLVEEHREVLSEFFPVTPSKLFIMSRAYIHDERFREHYESQQAGFAQWLADAIEEVARCRGVDVDNVVWG